MAELDTAAEREAWRKARLIGEQTSLTHADHALPKCFAEIDRLRGENDSLRDRAQIAREQCDTAESRAKEAVQREMAALRAENQRLREAVLAADRVFRAQEDESPHDIYGVDSPVVYAQLIDADVDAFERIANELKAQQEAGDHE